MESCAEDLRKKRSLDFAKLRNRVAGAIGRELGIYVLLDLIKSVRNICFIQKLYRFSGTGYGRRYASQ